MVKYRPPIPTSERKDRGEVQKKLGIADVQASDQTRDLANTNLKF